MLLKKWRDGRPFREVSAETGINHSTLYQLENGLVFPSPETAVKLESATKAQVGLYDHMCAWKRAHHEAFTKARDAGRAAAKAHSDAAKKEATHGKTRKRQRQEP